MGWAAGAWSPAHRAQCQSSGTNLDVIMMLPAWASGVTVQVRTLGSPRGHVQVTTRLVTVNENHVYRGAAGTPPGPTGAVATQARPGDCREGPLRRLPAPSPRKVGWRPAPHNVITNLSPIHMGGAARNRLFDHRQVY